MGKDTCYEMIIIIPYRCNDVKIIIVTIISIICSAFAMCQLSSSFVYNFFYCGFIDLFLAMLGLRCCMGYLSSCSARVHCHGFSYCKAPVLGMWAQ